MTPDQLTRLEALRDRLVDRALEVADPSNWSGSDKLPRDMTKDERGNAHWCSRLAVQTVSLTMQVMRMVSNPSTGGAIVPTEQDAPQETPEESIEAEVARFEAAAADVLASRTVKAAKDGSRAKR